jgi:hypothetical protein
MLAATAAGVRAAPPTVEEMFGKPDYLGATLSPSGRYLAVIAPVDGGRRGVGIMVAINRNGDSQRVLATRSKFERPWSVALLRTLPASTEVLLTARESSRNSLDLYRLDTLRLEKLFSYRRSVDSRTMASARSVRYRACDGLSIPALLTIPAKSVPRGCRSSSIFTAVRTCRRMSGATTARCSSSRRAATPCCSRSFGAPADSA